MIMHRVSSLIASGACVLLALTACDSSIAANGNKQNSTAASGAAGIKVGVILPETDTSPRWETFDRPFLNKYLRQDGLIPIIQNAQGDDQKFSTLADEMIASGVKVLIITSIDSASGAAVEARANAAGIPVIDYDRINLGGSAKYYVAFDNEKIGELQAQALKTAVGSKPGANIIEIEGSPTDNNATGFHDGHQAVLGPLFKSGAYKLVGTKFADQWSNEVGGTAFEQILTGNHGKVDGVLAANDGLGLAVVTVLKKYGLNGKVPVTGQDATAAGLQAVLRGDMYMTIFKPIDKQAKAAADLAADLAKGDTAAASKIAAQVSDDPVGHRKVPSVLLGAQIITKDKVKIVTDAGFVSASQVCVADLIATCQQLGIK
jgi:D-xylose transport system substrate-binding protein